MRTHPLELIDEVPSFPDELDPSTSDVIPPRLYHEPDAEELGLWSLAERPEWLSPSFRRRLQAA